MPVKLSTPKAQHEREYCTGSDRAGALDVGKWSSETRRSEKVGQLFYIDLHIRLERPERTGP